MAKRRYERVSKPVAQLSMSTASHDRCGPALLERVDESSITDGAIASSKADEPATTINVSESAVSPVISVAVMHRHARRYRPSHALGAGAASVVLHAGVLFAAWQALAPSVVPWKLHLERGRNSVSLQASLPAIPSSVRETEVRVLPKPPTSPPRKSSAPPIPVTLEKKPNSTTSRPDKPEATVAETAMAQVTHPEILRKQLEAAPSDSESDEAEVRPPIVRRKNPAQLPLQLVIVEASSVASLGAAASSGADVPVPPHDVHRVLPKYPSESYAAGEEGTVVLWVRVDDQGIVLATGVKTSSGYPRLDAAAVAAMQQWRFAPATLGDTTRASVFKSSLTFTIPKSN